MGGEGNPLPAAAEQGGFRAGQPPAAAGLHLLRVPVFLAGLASRVQAKLPEKIKYNSSRSNEDFEYRIIYPSSDRRV